MVTELDILGHCLALFCILSCFLVVLLSTIAPNLSCIVQVQVPILFIPLIYTLKSISIIYTYRYIIIAYISSYCKTAAFTLCMRECVKLKSTDEVFAHIFFTALFVKYIFQLLLYFESVFILTIFGTGSSVLKF